jgi:hypothetical protein
MINTVTIAITTDTMYLAGAGTTGSRTLAAYGMATAVKVTSTSWIISGNGLTWAASFRGWLGRWRRHFRLLSTSLWPGVAVEGGVMHQHGQ